MEVNFHSQLCIGQYGGGFPCRQQMLVISQPIRRFFGSVAFEAVSAPEQYCSTPLLKVERSVSYRIGF